MLTFNVGETFTAFLCLQTVASDNDQINNRLDYLQTNHTKSLIIIIYKCKEDPGIKAATYHKLRKESVKKVRLAGIRVLTSAIPVPRWQLVMKLVRSITRKDEDEIMMNI